MASINEQTRQLKKQIHTLLTCYLFTTHIIYMYIYISISILPDTRSLRRYFHTWVCDGEMEKRRNALDTLWLWQQVQEHSCCGWRTLPLLSKTSRAVFGSLELTQLCPEMGPAPQSPRLSNKMLEMKNSSFSGLRPLKRPPWSMLPPEAKLVSAVSVPTGNVGFCDPCSRPRPG